MDTTGRGEQGVGRVLFVVPYAGSAVLLRETVASVRAQTDDGWRLVVVEDGPQDAGVRPWLEALDDARVTHRQNERRLGVAGNFQRCLDVAGEAGAQWVVLLGCDDRLGPGYVATVRAALAAHPDVDVVQPGVRVIDAEGRPTSPLGDRVKARIAPRGTGPRVVHGEPLLASLLHGTWTYFPSLCWRLEAIAAIGFRQDLQTTLDVALLGRLVLDGHRMLVLDDVVFDYRRHGASASSVAAVRTDRFDEEHRLFGKLAEAAAAQGWGRAARAGRWRATSRLHAALLLPAALRRRDRAGAGALLRHAVRR